MDSLRGRFLIASPHLPDLNFSRTVVLVVEHHEEGALGLVLNRPTSASIEDIWKFVDGTLCDSGECLRLGGPVEGNIMCIHADAIRSESEILPGVYLTTDTTMIREIAEADEHRYFIFWGYAGWGAGQLEYELKVGGWFVGDASADLVFSDDVHSLWKKVVARSGQDVLREALHISHFPDDPQLN